MAGRGCDRDWLHGQPRTCPVWLGRSTRQRLDQQGRRRWPRRRPLRVTPAAPDVPSWASRAVCQPPTRSGGWGLNRSRADRTNWIDPLADTPRSDDTCAAEHARVVCEQAGAPESELGSQRQERAHHLRVALTRTDALVASLGAKIERAVARKESRVPAVPTGARVLRRDGSYVEALVDGRVMTRSVSSRSWVLNADEQDFESGGLLCWVADGMPVFHDPRQCGHGRGCRLRRRRWSGRTQSACL